MISRESLVLIPVSTVRLQLQNITGKGRQPMYVTNISTRTSARHLGHVG